MKKWLSRLKIIREKLRYGVRNVKPKITTRRSTCPQSNKEFSYPREHLVPGYSDTNHAGLVKKSDLNLNTSRKFGEPSNSFYEGMSKGKYYEGMKHTSSEPIQAFLPVMSGDASMSHHYSGTPIYDTRKLSTARSYNDKARDALPGLGGGALDTFPVNDTIDGGNFHENPYMRPDLVNYEVKRSASLHTPGRSLSRSKFENFDPAANVPLDPYSSFENSAKRHELEILTKAEPRAVQFGEPNVDHLYRTSGCTSGYKVIAPTYENTNGTFSHTGGNFRGSFTVAPDWVSERKKSVVLRH
ncbi:uncharacterized protein LOC114529392 isoform X2 [Dendronephthya gigantea]|uniref:uncharacterized protein LOC114529392 isoform X2 n=1 Tax=Dendronephthya gigantea TaxID=151771 RepID=UPI00106BD4A1|nr:uncharacterized protein LOC114529392 isoform X2 [Dendronephthya gigantea]